MKKVFTQEDLNLIIEALTDQKADIEQEIVESEEANAATSVIFALSKDMVACELMIQFFSNVQEQFECMYSEGCTEDEAIRYSAFVESKEAMAHYQSVDQQ